MATGFERDIRPYFTACYRAHMLKVGLRAGGGFDLWAHAHVQDHWAPIFDSVKEGSMPRSGCGEGVWDDVTRAQFLTDFQSWKEGDFQP
jgi:hypothetical protein